MSKIDIKETLGELEKGSTPKWIAEHLQVYRESGGTKGHLWDSSAVGGPGLIPCLLLTTVGKRSGQKRTSPLLYGTFGKNHIVIGSKGGSPTHPHWYLNLLANPEVEVQVESEKFTARARVATGKEREEIWAHMLTVYPPYSDYQKRTTRQIPVIVLEKVA